MWSGTDRVGLTIPGITGGDGVASTPGVRFAGRAARPERIPGARRTLGRRGPEFFTGYKVSWSDSGRSTEDRREIGGAATDGRGACENS